MKHALSLAVIALLITACGPVAAPPAARGFSSNVYLKPDPCVGERFTDVFSRTVSTGGKGFKEHIGRINDWADYVVTALSPDAITLDLSVCSGAVPPPGIADGFLIHTNAVTKCCQDTCNQEDETSGLTFNRLSRGDAPREVNTGSHWRLTIPRPWEIGPADVDEVRVVSVDSANGTTTPARNGAAAGSFSDHLQAAKTGKRLTITTPGDRQIEVTLIRRKATWSGCTTVRKDIVVGDEVMVTRKVKPVAKDGKMFDGGMRASTLPGLAWDTM